MRVIIAARLSSKQRKDSQGRTEGIGLDTQDEQSREFCTREGWEVVATVRDTISGSVAPMNRRNLRQWVTDPARLAMYDGIVALKTDRLSRGEDVDWSRIESWAADHGKTLVIVSSQAGGIQYPSRGDPDYYQWMSEKRQAGRELGGMREKSGRAQKAIKAAGGWVGRAPYGYDIVGDRYGKRLEPNAAAADVILIFDKIAEGHSLRDVARMLSEGRPSKFWPRTVETVVRNEAYKGRARHGADVLEVPPLVSRDLWHRAGAKLSANPRGRRGPRAGNQPALLGSLLYCGPCRQERGVTSPMYRVGAKQGHAGYYRCYGRGADRRGCGLMLDLMTTEHLAVFMLTQGPEAQRPWVTVVTVEDGRAESIERARDALADAMAARPMDAGKVGALAAEVAAAEAAPEVGQTTSEVEHRAPDGSVITIGQRWQSLPREERRGWMLREGRRMLAWRAPAEYGGVRLAQWV